MTVLSTRRNVAITDGLNGLWKLFCKIADGTHNVQIWQHLHEKDVCAKTNVDEKESKILKLLLGGPHIVQFLGYNLTTGIMCMKSCSGGDLHDLHISRMKKNTVITKQERHEIMTQLLKAVHYMHSKGIVHRDIKLENVLFEFDDDGRIRIFLSDFGVSVFLSDFGMSVRQDAENRAGERAKREQNEETTRSRDKEDRRREGKKGDKEKEMTELKGTLSYFSPESLRCRSNVTCKDDAWSCAIVAYVLLVGQFPFEQRNVTEYIKKDDIDTEVLKSEPLYAQYILSTLVKECKRISVPDALTRYFSDVNVDQVADERAFKKRRKVVDTPRVQNPEIQLLTKNHSVVILL